MSVTVETVRDLNNRYGPNALPNGRHKVLRCPECDGRFNADLAVYFCPRDKEEFACPDCDIPLWLVFEEITSAGEPLAQRWMQDVAPMLEP